CSSSPTAARECSSSPPARCSDWASEGATRSMPRRCTTACWPSSTTPSRTTWRCSCASAPR
ncbi:MAG: hypothetical protein AVDCRST_MAG69-2712, partial [uncultured Solirubrobacteraceae bacterium]